ncbi:hypothetical protein PC9H_008812 [Pleurotus ostreatus]|uniref:Uncharacterized protein n=1 Tax=Pleurotus ostreatus TaxID=5322 RepID=A0A8H6ZPI2_PLEOS|nr:uncharacterized protein PC9H_008812 [Pleurotus ostreatus]KAF7426443.1 hypothetical protein PC9H_008812 [Pleurotus ostreatus]KAJ8693987.1 hypothetical protein PTI98_008921 [Pleurotus ostreatus]
MSRTKTTWEDLAHLGWYRYGIFLALNPVRGNTMKGSEDVTLNDDNANPGFYCYNTYKGAPKMQAPSYSESTTQTVVWEYNNRTHEVFKDSWRESWQNTEHVSATVTKGATIRINSSVHIEGLFDLPVGFDFSQDSEQTKSRDKSYEFTYVWNLIVEPGQHGRLVRTTTTKVGTQECLVTFGLEDYPNDQIGTKGAMWNGYTNWGYSAHSYLTKHPLSGTMVISASLNKVDHSYFFEYLDSKGEVVSKELVSMPTHGMLSLNGGEATAVAFAVGRNIDDGKAVA